MAWNRFENKRLAHYKRTQKQIYAEFKRIGEDIGSLEVKTYTELQVRASKIITSANFRQILFRNNAITASAFGKEEYAKWANKKSFNPLLFSLLLNNEALTTSLLIANASRNILNDIIMDSIENGLSIPNVTKILAERFGFDKKRAKRIARTEVVGASNLGSYEGARQSGHELLKFWMATKDKRTRPTHKAADGQTVQMEQKFRVGLSLLSYPGDKAGSAREIINCRCAIGYKEP